MAASISINTINSNLIVNSRPARIQMDNIIGEIRIEKTPQNFQVRSRDSELRINNYPARSQLYNSKKTQDMVEETASRSKQKGFEAIAAYSRDGDRLMAIDRGGNAIAEISKRRASQFSDVSVNVGFFPKNSIEISATTPSVSVQSTPSQIKTRVIDNFRYDVIPGGVDIRVDRPAEVKVEVVGENIDYIA